MQQGNSAGAALQTLSLLTLARWYNILLIVLAQYLTAVFALGDGNAATILQDVHLHLLIFCTGLTIASGFIMNHFYDVERDLIHRPERTRFERLTSPRVRLHAYVLFNVVAVGLAWVISMKAALFFAAYAFAMWFYSHKVKKVPVISNAAAASLALVPFASIFLYYHLLPVGLIGFLLVIFFTEWARGLSKDLEAATADIIVGRPTIPALLGETRSKWAFTALVGAAIALLGSQALFAPNLGLRLAMMVGTLALMSSIPTVWLAQQPAQYRWVNRILKGVILGGLASIPFLP